ncbi:CotY/CotZ family spore coat protein [Terribacillus sp. JSM ZJ617]|uniref:CotY/CotZ family spore coat protein n=1 Tax=Terribacillus sp. JSM ZJ617 TaxID=3342119 RepID=UPI0035A93612
MSNATRERESSSIVVDIVREIANAQRDISSECCATSAEQSINDLLGTLEDLLVSIQYQSAFITTLVVSSADME